MQDNRLEDARLEENLSSYKGGEEYSYGNLCPAYLCECVLEISNKPGRNNLSEFDSVESYQWESNLVEEGPLECGVEETHQSDSQALEISKVKSNTEKSYQLKHNGDQIELLECNPTEWDPKGILPQDPKDRDSLRCNSDNGTDPGRVNSKEIDVVKHNEAIYKECNTLNILDCNAGKTDDVENNSKEIKFLECNIEEIGPFESNLEEIELLECNVEEVDPLESNPEEFNPLGCNVDEVNLLDSNSEETYSVASNSQLVDPPEDGHIDIDLIDKSNVPQGIPLKYNSSKIDVQEYNEKIIHPVECKLTGRDSSNCNQNEINHQTENCKPLIDNLGDANLAACSSKEVLSHSNVLESYEYEVENEHECRESKTSQLETKLGDDNEGEVNVQKEGKLSCRSITDINSNCYLPVSEENLVKENKFSKPIQLGTNKLQSTGQPSQCENSLIKKGLWECENKCEANISKENNLLVCENIELMQSEKVALEQGSQECNPQENKPLEISGYDLEKNNSLPSESSELINVPLSLSVGGEDKSILSNLIEKSVSEEQNRPPCYQKGELPTKVMSRTNGKRVLKVVLCRLEDEEIGKLWKKSGLVSLLGRSRLKAVGKSNKKEIIKKKKFKCCVCKKSFINKERYNEHRASKCDKVRVFGCDNCSRKYVLKRLLNVHRVKCILVRHFKCNVCTKIFNSQERLDEHNASRCDTQKVFSCDVCSRGFVFKRLLLLHKTPICTCLRRHKCSICKESFHQHEMKSHKAREHGLGIRSNVLCEVCGKLISRRVLTDHVQNHSDEVLFQCKVCSKKFKTKCALYGHKKSHIKLKLFNCADCGKSFKDLKSLKKHISGSNNSLTFYTCKVCGKIIQNKICFQAHLETHLPVKSNGGENAEDPVEEKPYKCEECEKCFSQRIIFQQHLKDAHPTTSPINCVTEKIQIPLEDRPYPCPKCNKRFSQNHYLRKHLRRVHKAPLFVREIPSDKKSHACDKRVTEELKISLEDRSYPCPNCNKCFSLNYNLRRHLRRMHNAPCLVRENTKIPSAQAPFVCNKCGSCFRVQSYLNRHYRRVHSVADVYACNFCQETFKTTFLLERHTYEHFRRCFLTKSEDEPKRYTCQGCGKCFNKFSSLRKHCVVLNSGTNICWKAFKEVYNQTQPISHPTLSTIHQEIEQNLHVCEECGMKFFEKWRLNKHLLSHTEQSFTCDICKKGFNTQMKFSIHMLVHGVKADLGSTLKCLTCGKSFSSSDNLHKHLLVHTEESPHKCSKCDRSFTTQYSLKRHNNTVHSDKRFSCKYCKMSFFAFSSLNQHVMYVHKKSVSLSDYVLKIEDEMQYASGDTLEHQLNYDQQTVEKAIATDITPDLKPEFLTDLSNMFGLSNLYISSLIQPEKTCQVVEDKISSESIYAALGELKEEPVEVVIKVEDW